MSVMPLEYVAAPPITPLAGGILAAAVVVDDSDPHGGYGFEYQPDYCGKAEQTVAACIAAATVGSVTGAEAAGRVLTLTFTNAPAGSYPITVLWGDGGSSTLLAGNAVHTYQANGTYQVSVQGTNGWRASGPVVIDNVAGATAPLVTVAPKTDADGVPVVAGTPFAVYHMTKCRTVGMDDATSRAENALRLGEGRAVAAWLGVKLKAEAVDVSNASITGLVAALAALEHHALNAYGGVPTIHMMRGAASILAAEKAIYVDGPRLRTQLGSVVSADAYNSFVSTSVTPFDQQWMWATGTVMLRRGPVNTMSPPPDLYNEQRVLAERPYSGAYECFAVGIKVTPPIAAVATAQSSEPLPTEQLETGTDEMTGPDSWSPPAGTLRSVTISVTSGTATVDGEPVSAPNVVSFDADEGESLHGLNVELASGGDRALVSWVVHP